MKRSRVIVVMALALFMAFPVLGWAGGDSPFEWSSSNDTVVVNQTKTWYCTITLHTGTGGTKGGGAHYYEKELSVNPGETASWTGVDAPTLSFNASCKDMSRNISGGGRPGQLTHHPVVNFDREISGFDRGCKNGTTGATHCRTTITFFWNIDVRYEVGAK